MLGHVDMQASVHNMRGPPRRHSALFHLLSRQLNHRSPRPPSTSSHHVSDYQPKYQLDNLSADRVYHIGSTANSPVSGDRIDRESVRRRTPQRRRFLHASRMAFPRGITGRRVGPLGLDPPFASPSTANFVAEAVRWRGSRRYQTARAELTACYLDPRLGTYHPVIWNNLIRFANPRWPFINVPVDDVAMAAAAKLLHRFFRRMPCQSLGPQARHP